MLLFAPLPFLLLLKQSTDEEEAWRDCESEIQLRGGGGPGGPRRPSTKRRCCSCRRGAGAGDSGIWRISRRSGGTLGEAWSCDCDARFGLELKVVRRRFARISLTERSWRSALREEDDERLRDAGAVVGGLVYWVGCLFFGIPRWCQGTYHVRASSEKKKDAWPRETRWQSAKVSPSLTEVGVGDDRLERLPQLLGVKSGGGAYVSGDSHHTGSSSLIEQ